LLPDTDNDKKGLPHFYLNVECGGGTYIRSLIRDMGHSLDTYATMTSLVRTKQGPFTLDDTFEKDEWNPDTLYAAIEKSNQYFASLDQTSEETE
jgi:tRNA pseudouridine55 synthase